MKIFAITHVIRANLQIEKVFAIRNAQNFWPCETTDAKMAAIYNDAGEGYPNEDIDIFQILMKKEKTFQNASQIIWATIQIWPISGLSLGCEDLFGCKIRKSMGDVTQID